MDYTLGKNAEGQNVEIDAESLKGLNLLVGKGGSGKTKLIRSLFIQDVQKGNRAFYVDYYGDFSRTLQEDAEISTKVKFVTIGSTSEDNYFSSNRNGNVEVTKTFEDFIIDYVFRGSVYGKFQQSVRAILENKSDNSLELLYKALSNYMVSISEVMTNDLHSFGMDSFYKQSPYKEMISGLYLTSYSLENLISQEFAEVFVPKGEAFGALDVIESDKSVVICIPSNKYSSEQIYYLSRILIIGLLAAIENKDINTHSFYFEELSHLISFDWMSLISRLKDRNIKTFISLQTFTLGYKETMLSPRGRIFPDLISWTKNFFIFESSPIEMDFLSGELNLNRSLIESKRGEWYRFKERQSSNSVGIFA